MLRGGRVWFWAALLALAASAPLEGQGPTTGALSGQVRDALGAPVAGARVSLRTADGGAAHTALTAGAGEFRFALLPAGDYLLSVEADGHAPGASALSLNAGVEVQVSLALPPGGGGGGIGGSGGVSPGDLDLFATRVGLTAGVVEPLSGRSLGLALTPRGDLGALARLLPELDASLGAEGLPGSLTTLLIDGTPFRPAAHPLDRGSPFRSSALPLAGFRSAGLVADALDAQWPGAAGAVLSLQSRSGTEGTRLGARLRWSGDALPGATSVDAPGTGFNDLLAGFELSAGAGSARVALGGQASREQAPLAPAWPSSEAARAAAAAATEGGLPLGDPTRARATRVDALALSGRLDWDASPLHRLEASAHLATLPSVRLPTGAFQLPGWDAPTLEGMDLIFGAALHSTLSERVANLARVGVTHSTRAAGGTDPVATTLLAGEGLAFGVAARAAETEETRLHLQNTVQHHAGPHTLSAGVTLELGTYRYRHREDADGAFFFGSAELLRARQGVALRVEGPAPLTEWRTPRGALFVQDHWRVRPGLELLVGGLLERRPLPGTELPRDRAWFQLTGVANDAAQSPGWRFTPRVGASWDAAGDGRWRIDLAAGSSYDEVDPLLLAQWQHDAVGVRVRRVVGSVSWPEPGGGGAPLRTLTVLAPGFEAPRTSRVSAALTHRLGDATVLRVRALSRRTEALPRRRDLNLLPLPTAHDQHGRPLYGTLVKQGSLLAALPATGRRFEGWDEVVGVAADGWSEHRGVSVGVEHAAGPLSLTARYAFGRTRDDGFGGDWSVGPPGGFTDEAWLEGRADLDAPHRFAGGAVVEPLPGLRVSGLYRYASGRPFTPGLGAAVDANGDGVFGNDPAFVDAGLPGMAALLERWSCLRAASGSFVPRNACRGEGTHGADLRADWTGARFGRAAATFTVELFNLLDPAPSVPDAALYRVDPAAELVYDTETRRLALPLVVNPAFGRPLDAPQPGRLLRLGLSLTW